MTALKKKDRMYYYLVLKQVASVKLTLKYADGPLFFFFLRTGCAEKKQPLEIDAMTGCAKANWIMYLYQLYASVHPENSAVFYKQACCL